jgi:hypothetical protein
VELLQLMEILKELDPLFRDWIIQQIKLMANLHKKSKETKKDGQNGKKPRRARV